MRQRVVRVASVASSRALGRRLGRLLDPGSFVGLLGEMGAGKTELVRAICAGAGVSPAAVSSPSFAIIAAYRGKRLPIFHADLFRVTGEDELFATGYFDLIGGPGAVLVEWIDRVESAAPWDHLRIAIEVTGPRSRRMRVSSQGLKHDALLDAWLPRGTTLRK